MHLTELTNLLRYLQDRDVRFLIAGGLAVVAHGHTRVTHDLDLVLAMDTDNLQRALDAFAELAFVPRLPVRLEDFADDAKRREWIETKGMQVFSLVSDRFPSLVVDLFAEAPFAFDEEWENAAWIAFPDPDGPLPFVSLSALQRMKAAAGRPVDIEDLRHLNFLQDESEPRDS